MSGETSLIPVKESQIIKVGGRQPLLEQRILVFVECLMVFAARIVWWLGLTLPGAVFHSSALWPPLHAFIMY